MLSVVYVESLPPDFECSENIGQPLHKYTYIKRPIYTVGRAPESAENGLKKNILRRNGYSVLWYVYLVLCTVYRCSEI